jgi:hypothetical protein
MTVVIFRSRAVSAGELERATGWHLTPDGLCRDEVCVPFVAPDENAIDLAAAARALGRPLVHDEAHGLWALGAEAGGRALTSATAPELELPDMEGRTFRLASLRGQKVLLVAWASW